MRAENGIAPVAPTAEAGPAPIKERVAIPAIPGCARREGREIAARRDIGDDNARAPRERNPGPACRPFRLASIAEDATLPVGRVQHDDLRPPAGDLRDREILAIGFPRDRARIARLCLYAAAAEHGIVTYTAGFTETPSEIAQAYIELVARHYRERTRIGEVSKALGTGETVTFSQKDMSEDVKTALLPYRVAAPAGFARRLAPTMTDTALLTAAL